MAQSKPSLTGFLQSLYREKLLKPKSFEDYLADSGTDHRKAFDGALKEAYFKRSSSDPGYGSVGESLASSGLSRAGYSGYLADKAERGLKSDLSRAREQRDSLLAKARSGYSQYLEKQWEKRRNAIDGITGSIIDRGITDLNTAYGLALSSGLYGDEALATATNAVNRSKERLLKQAIDSVVKEGLDPNAAGLLAENLGLKGKDRERVVSYAKELSSSRTEDAGKLIEYLENYGSSNTVSGDRLATALEEYVKTIIEERNKEQ